MDENQIIDALGGTAEVARIFDITSGAVSQWRKDGIPSPRLMYIKLRFPHLFCAGDPDNQPKTEATKEAA